MEIALHPDIPTYSGGLGMLAGDTLRAAADLGISMIAVTLMHRQGYFSQSLDASGWQHEDPIPWNIERYCHELPIRTDVTIEGRYVQLRAWKYEVTGCGRHVIPVLLLDTDLDENSDWDRTLTNNLYGGDSHYRLCQEVVLGVGGVRVLRALGYNDVARFHMNEGHAALLGLELLDESAKSSDRSPLTPKMCKRFAVAAFSRLILRFLRGMTGSQLIKSSVRFLDLISLIITKCFAVPAN